MKIDSLLKLQNGSDIRGVALQLPNGAAVTLSPTVATHIAKAFAFWLAARTQKKVSELRIGVGHDSRLTATSLKNAIIDGFCAVGARAFDCALASTPAMFMGTVFHETAFDGAVMITASHLPKERNGMKFFTKTGGLEKQDISDILNLDTSVFALAAYPQQAENCKLMPLYAASLRKKIIDDIADGNAPLNGLHVLVDAGNGAGGFFVDEVLLPLGANCGGSQFLDPDGNFPNHQPNPENKEAMASICAAVVKNNADLGIIFDTDVDRMSAVFPSGQAVNRNAIIALMSAVLAKKYPNSTIVTDSVTSDLLTEFLEKKLSLKHRRFKRGYRNVIGEALRLNAEGTPTPLAIETSGHGALLENFFLDDGAYMAVCILVAAAKTKREGQALSSLLDGFETASHELEYRLSIVGDDFTNYGNSVLAGFEKQAIDSNLVLAQSEEGVRITFAGKGWALLRLSLHDPVLPLNIEAYSDTYMQEIQRIIVGLLKEYKRLDCPELFAADK